MAHKFDDGTKKMVIGTGATRSIFGKEIAVRGTWINLAKEALIQDRGMKMCYSGVTLPET